MAQQRRGLGRGLGALIPDSARLAGVMRPAGPAPAPGRARRRGRCRPPSSARWRAPATRRSRSPRSRPNPRQPRRTFDEEALDELADSIREVGLLQPVVVRAAGAGQYELIMGERRWRAAQRAGLTDIGAIVKQTQDDDLLRDALIENLHRQQLDPLEEAAAYQQLLDDFGATHEELAQQDRPLPPAYQQHPPAAEPAARGAEAGGGGRAQRRPRPRSAEPGGSRSAGSPGEPDRGRGPVGPGGRGDRRGRLR